jgi:hypothetical protein
MAGLVPAIHVFNSKLQKDVDAAPEARLRASSDAPSAGMTNEIDLRQ